MNKHARLVAINKRWKARCSCTLRTSSLQAVIGEGDANADIVFIGEAPGKKEDEQGRPFVGAAGKFLDEMLRTITLKRDDIYITNIVKYRPPNNRDPFPEEIAACQKWLTDEIQIIQPKIIVTLGRYALNYFLPKQTISAIHGTVFQTARPDIGMPLCFSLYHPAAALYNGKMRTAIIKDFQYLSLIIKTMHKKTAN